MTWSPEERRAFVRQLDETQSALAAFYRYFLIGVVILVAGWGGYIFLVKLRHDPNASFLQGWFIFAFLALLGWFANELRYINQHRRQSSLGDRLQESPGPPDHFPSGVAIGETLREVRQVPDADKPDRATLAVAEAYLQQGKDLDTACRLISARYSHWTSAEQRAYQASVRGSLETMRAEAGDCGATPTPTPLAPHDESSSFSLADFHRRAMIDVGEIKSRLSWLFRLVPIPILVFAGALGLWLSRKMPSAFASEFLKPYFSVLLLLAIVYVLARSRRAPEGSSFPLFTLNVQSSPQTMSLDAQAVDAAARDLFEGRDLETICRQTNPQYDRLSAIQKQLYQVCLARGLEMWRDQKQASAPAPVVVSASSQSQAHQRELATSIRPGTEKQEHRLLSATEITLFLLAFVASAIAFLLFFFFRSAIQH